MRRLRIYADTSVIGGCFDEEFAEDSLRLCQAAREGRVLLLVSDVVLRELELAPTHVVDMLDAMPNGSVVQIELNDDVFSLRDAYIAEGVVGPSHGDDATHVAAATVARADAIVSWNFKHIVRLDRMKAYNRINVLNGYGILTIVSPREVRIDEPTEDEKDV